MKVHEDFINAQKSVKTDIDALPPVRAADAHPTSIGDPAVGMPATSSDALPSVPAAGSLLMLSGSQLQACSRCIFPGTYSRKVYCMFNRFNAFYRIACYIAF